MVTVDLLDAGLPKTFNLYYFQQNTTMLSNYLKYINFFLKKEGKQPK